MQLYVFRYSRFGRWWQRRRLRRQTRRYNFSIAGHWIAYANLVCRARLCIVYMAASVMYVYVRTLDAWMIYGWCRKWPIHMWNESQSPSHAMWTGCIFSEYIFGGIGIACFHWRSIKFVSNAKVPIWICCVVGWLLSANGKPFFSAVSMVKEVSGAEWERESQHSTRAFETRWN